MRSTLLALAALGIATRAEAQDSGIRWSLSTGPTIAAFSGGIAACPNTCAFSSTDDRIITGAEHGKYNVALGVSRRWNGTALTVRGEVLYNRSESPLHREWHSLLFGGDSLFVPHYQGAPIDEVFAGTLGFEWDALPAKSVSPYLLTSIGWGLNRLRWNSNPDSSRIDTQRDEAGPIATFGAGVRVQVGKHEFFFEWRRYHSWNLPGAQIIPFSLGFRF